MFHISIRLIGFTGPYEVLNKCSLNECLPYGYALTISYSNETSGNKLNFINLNFMSR